MLLFVIIGFLLVVFIYQSFFMKKNIKSVPAADLDRLLRDKTNRQLIDVRNQLAFEKGHIKGFKNIPLSELPKYLEELPKEEEIVVIGEDNSQSNKACSLLGRVGFSKVINVSGGMSTYVKSK